MDIDWSKAPEGATHCRVGDPEMWLLYSYGIWRFWCGFNWSGPSVKPVGEVIPRPTKAPEVDWDGQTFIQAGHRLQARVNDNPWLSGEITYRSDSGVVFRPDDGGDELFWRFALFDIEFRPIRTKEQRQREELIEVIKGYHFEDGWSSSDEGLADYIMSCYTLEPKP